MTDDLYNLELLSLVAKITQEIDNYTGISDKTLAEFVISLHEKSKTLGDFKTELKNVGADFPAAFIENVDRLILSMHPKHNKRGVASSAAAANGDETNVDSKDKQRRLFPGLSMADKEWEPSVTKDDIYKEVDDLMSQLEGTAKKSRARPAEEEPQARKRRRDSRSPSPDRGRGRDRDRGRNGYGHGSQEQSGRSDRRGNQMDERPVLFKIYRGKVAGLKEFGAFVNLVGVAGRVEGEPLHLLLGTEVDSQDRTGARIKYSSWRAR